MSETPLTFGEVVKSYHEAEKRSLDELVAQGSLGKEEAPNGTMYVLPLGTRGFPVAISVNNIIVRSGDDVKLERSTPGGVVSANTEISEFGIDSGDGEIKGRMRPETPPILRVSDIKFNRSAQVRAVNESPGKIIIKGKPFFRDET